MYISLSVYVFVWFCLFVFGRVSLYSPARPKTHVEQASVEFIEIHLPVLPKC